MKEMAETEGFEPSVPVKVRTLSRGVVSASSPTSPFVEWHYSRRYLKQS